MAIANYLAKEGCLDPTSFQTNTTSPERRFSPCGGRSGRRSIREISCAPRLIPWEAIDRVSGRGDMTWNFLIVGDAKYFLLLQGGGCCSASNGTLG